MPSADDVCTTQEAARILGISTTSVQQLVELGVLAGWKTKGGHRRIPLSSVHAYKASISGDALPPIANQGKAVAATTISSVLIVEDNELQCDLYKQVIPSWELPLAITFCENGYKALVEIAHSKPDIVLADIVLEGMDGYEMINTILGYPELADVSLAVISSLSINNINERGGLPQDVVYFEKPVNFDELRGFLRACRARKARMAK